MRMRERDIIWATELSWIIFSQGKVFPCVMRGGLWCYVFLPTFLCYALDRAVKMKLKIWTWDPLKVLCRRSVLTRRVCRANPDQSHWREPRCQARIGFPNGLNSFIITWEIRPFSSCVSLTWEWVIFGSRVRESRGKEYCSENLCEIFH